MGEENPRFTKEMQALVAAALKDADSPPNLEEILSQNQQGELATPTHASPFVSGASPLRSNAQGLNWPNNIQREIPKTTAPKPPTQVNADMVTNDGSQPYDPANPSPFDFIVGLCPAILQLKEKLTDDAKEMMQDSVSDFIHLVMNEAFSNCKGESITGADIMAAVARLGFSQFVEPVQMFLQRYRDNEMLPVIPNTDGGYECAVDNELMPYVIMHPQCDMVFDAAGNVDGYYLHEPTGTSAAGKRTNAQAFGVVTPAVSGNGQGVPVSIRGSPSGGDRGAGPSDSSVETRNNAQTFGVVAPAVSGARSGLSVTTRGSPNGGGAGVGPSSSSAGTRNNAHAFSVAGGDAGAGPSRSSTYGMCFYDHYPEYM